MGPSSRFSNISGCELELTELKCYLLASGTAGVDTPKSTGKGRVPTKNVTKSYSIQGSCVLHELGLSEPMNLRKVSRDWLVLSI